MFRAASLLNTIGIVDSLAAARPMDRGSLPLRRSLRQTLLIDADDTLWENNIYFERAITSFISYLDHRVHTNEEVREHLNTCERATIAKVWLWPQELSPFPGRLLRAALGWPGYRRETCADCGIY